LVLSNIYGQDVQLSIKFSDSSKLNKTNPLHYKKKHKNKVSVYSEIDSFLKQLDSIGYINSKINTVIQKDDLYNTYLHLGSQIKSITINYKDITLSEIDEITKKYTITITDNHFTIPFDKIAITLQNIANYFESSGRSFTNIRLKNISFKNNKAIATLQIEQSKRRTIDKIIIKGYDQFPKKFLQHELNIKTGTIFNKELLKYISSSINQLNFVSETKSPEVLFTKDSTYIYLYLKKNKSNKFDGVLGFASKENGSGLDFNGYLDFYFQNIFNKGESISFLWKNNGNQSQKLHLGTKIPYLFNTPISPEINFKLFRQDSTFNNTNLRINVFFPLHRYGEISAIYNTENSSNLLKESFQDPTIQSFKNIFYGGSYHFKLLRNNSLFPVKFQFDLNVLMGNRKIEDFKTNQSKFILFTNYTYEINRKNYIFIQNQSALLKSENFVSNELFRFGGANSFRGVNEESIFASMYTIFNLEYRFRPTENSFFYSITDYTFFQNELIYKNSNMYSLGLGYAFTTKIGLLNISYAIAKQQDTNFNFENSKIHIKIISYF
jgi:hypothetical protein